MTESSGDSAEGGAFQADRRTGPDDAPGRQRAVPRTDPRERVAAPFWFCRNDLALPSRSGTRPVHRLTQNDRDSGATGPGTSSTTHRQQIRRSTASTCIRMSVPRKPRTQIWTSTLKRRPSPSSKRPRSHKTVACTRRCTEKTPAGIPSIEALSRSPREAWSVPGMTTWRTSTMGEGLSSSVIPRVRTRSRSTCWEPSTGPLRFEGSSCPPSSPARTCRCSRADSGRSRRSAPVERMFRPDVSLTSTPSPRLLRPTPSSGSRCLPPSMATPSRLSARIRPPWVAAWAPSSPCIASDFRHRRWPAVRARASSPEPLRRYRHRGSNTTISTPESA